MFDWRDYIAVAEHLLSRGDEGSYRACASRAYYAAYNLARALVPSEVRNSREEGSHEKVWKYLKECRGPQQKIYYSLGTSGFTLKEYRVRADYKPGSTYTKFDAQAALDRAKTMLKQIEILPKEGTAT